MTLEAFETHPIKQVRFYKFWKHTPSNKSDSRSYGNIHYQTVASLEALETNTSKQEKVWNDVQPNWIV